MTSQLDLSKIYTNTRMDRIVALGPSMLTSEFSTHLINVLRKDVEGKCNPEGYVEAGSVEIQDHGWFCTEAGRFRGKVRVPVTFTANVCNLTQGDIIECQVKSFNQFGIMAASGPLNVVIPTTDQADLQVHVGQVLKAMVVNRQFKLNDDVIEVYATLVSDKNVVDLPEEELTDIDTDAKTDAEDTGEDTDAESQRGGDDSDSSSTSSSSDTESSSDEDSHKGGAESASESSEEEEEEEAVSDSETKKADGGSNEKVIKLKDSYELGADEYADKIMDGGGDEVEDDEADGGDGVDVGEDGDEDEEDGESELESRAGGDDELNY